MTTTMIPTAMPVGPVRQLLDLPKEAKFVYHADAHIGGVYLVLHYDPLDAAAVSRDCVRIDPDPATGKAHLSLHEIGVVTSVREVL